MSSIGKMNFNYPNYNAYKSNNNVNKSDNNIAKQNYAGGSIVVGSKIRIQGSK